ncbi:MAG: cell division protein FtsK [Bacilli bacterium]|nr:cell division protein FtsK [Bacilli bacterium]
MAKRKRRRSRSGKIELSVEIYALIVVILAMIGAFKLGPVGRIIASFGLFVSGSVYMGFLILAFIIGLYAFWKRDWPEFISTKMLGFYLFIIGILTLMHWGFVKVNDFNSSVIFKETMNELVKGFNSLMATGTIGDSASVGGGIIGGVFSILFTKLFSYTGMQIVTWVFIVLGICMFTGFSIADFIRDRLDAVKERVEKVEGKIKEEDNKLFNNKQVKISNGNDDDDNKREISPEDLKKSNTSEVTTPMVEEVHTSNSINPAYKLPPLDILNKPKNKNSEDNTAIEGNISKLENVLKSFGVIAKVVEVHVGPTVSQYELEIASGTRVNKITTLSREIALSLSKKDVRIEAPIPGKSTVGIEFANDNPNAVSFYEIMDSKVMKTSFEKKLMVPLGKSIMGDIGVCEINKMPHLLIAGTTGSGKSVCVNGIICAILMRTKPDEVKLALVDPKVVELSCYNGVPHLVRPVVTDPKEASTLLRKMVAEMEKRYHMFANTGTKQIEGYNEYVRRYNKTHPGEELDKMPYIVVIIDELSDLMMVAAKEVEDSILRITQKARAAGIHLIVATQRPSTEVITGLIKANIPSRISFAVGSGIDSRTILDQTGAEKLLGKGDMLYLPIGMNSPIRIQGSFIHDNEIEKIISFVKSQQEVAYDSTFANLEEEKKEEVSEKSEAREAKEASDDALYNEIVDFVVRSGKASASLLQRKFKIGYNKAATMIDELEENGVIGPATGNSKPREVLVKYSEKTEE